MSQPNIFQNPDVAQLYMLLKEEIGAKSESQLAAISDLRMEFELTRQRTDQHESAIRELRAADQIFTELGRSFAEQNHKVSALTDTINQMFGKLDSVSQHINELTSSRGAMTGTIADLKASHQNMSTKQQRHEETMLTAMKELEDALAAEQSSSQAFKAHVRGSAKMLMWIIGLASAAIFALSSWVGSELIRQGNDIARLQQAEQTTHQRKTSQVEGQ